VNVNETLLLPVSASLLKSSLGTYIPYLMEQVTPEHDQNEEESHHSNQDTNERVGIKASCGEVGDARDGFIV
jgi:hypothetical protein